MLKDQIYDTLEKLDANLTTLELRCRFCEKPHDFEKERELKIFAKEEINEIERLKEETEYNKDELLDHSSNGENKYSKLLTDLNYERKETLQNIAILESKLAESEISPERIDRIKNSIL